MKILIQLFFLCLMDVWSLQAQSIQVFENTQRSKTDIYLLIGQSNMAGRAELGSGDDLIIRNVFLLNNDDKFEVARNPLNRYSTIRKSLDMQKLGPGYKFAQSLSQMTNDKSIGLVVNARGGSSIADWQPKGKYLNEIIRRARAAQNFGCIKGVLWHQGESDCESVGEYSKQFKKMVRTLRKSLGLKNLPFFVGELGKWRTSYLGINTVLNKLSKKRENIYLVKADSLPHKGDVTHFSRESQLILGQRYAQKVNEIVYKNIKNQK